MVTGDVLELLLTAGLARVSRFHGFWARSEERGIEMWMLSFHRYLCMTTGEYVFRLSLVLTDANESPAPNLAFIV